MDSELFQQSLLTGKVVTAWDGEPEKSRVLSSDKAVCSMRNFGYQFPYLIPAEILNDYYISRGNIDAFRKLRMAKTRRPYDPRLFVVVKKIVESQRRTRIEKILYAPNSIPKTLEQVLGHGQRRRGIYSFPKNRVLFGTGDPTNIAAPCPFVGKENFEGEDNVNENPCVAGAKAIIEIMRKNDEALEKYNDALAEYTSAKAKWESDRVKEESECRDFSNRTCSSGWTSPTVSSSTIGRKCDDNCLNTYGGQYEYTGKADNKNLGTKWKYYCEFSNKSSVRKTCINRWDAKNPPPVEPAYPALTKIPDFICQNCPNTTTIEGSIIDEESVLSQANSCVIQQEKTTNISVDTSPSPDIELPKEEPETETSPEAEPSSEKTTQESESAIDGIMMYIIIAIVVSLIIGVSFYLRRKNTINGGRRRALSSRSNFPPFV